MYILKDVIVDVPINKKLEVDLIQCFMEKNEYVLICSYDYIDEEIKYLEMLKEKHGESIEISNNLNSEIRYGKKPCAYRFDYRGCNKGNCPFPNEYEQIKPKIVERVKINQIYFQELN